MSTIASHPLRVIGRLAWLSVELFRIAISFCFEAGLGTKHSLPARARWLHRGCRRVLRVFKVEIAASGKIPTCGLLVSNHLSYLDVLVLGALTPSVFVAKRQVGKWPVFGWFARTAGTVFVQREKRAQTRHVAAAIEAALDRDVLVILFPEGTSSAGNTVLPFKSALLEPALNRRCALTAGALQYELKDGDVSEEVCYWREMTLLPHLLNLLSKHSIRALARFTPVQPPSTNRKELARCLHWEVSKMNLDLLTGNSPANGVVRIQIEEPRTGEARDPIGNVTG